MIKELIASVLLSISIAPKNAVEDELAPYRNVWYSGAYCISDTVDFDVAFRTIPYEVSGSQSTINFDYTNTMFVYDYSRTMFGVVQELSIETDDFIYLSFTHSGDYDVVYNIDEGNTFSQLDNDTKYGIMYFPQSWFCNDICFNWFMLNFTAPSNSEMFVYTGWYTFNNTIPSVATRYTIMGNFSINNSFYNFIDFQNTSVLGYYYSNDYVNNVAVRTGGIWQVRRNVYFTGVVIPPNLRSVLDARGVFGYVAQDDNVETFDDLFFSIADTPIKLLTDMFNFDLLGMKFGYAVISILTLLIIVVVLKKLI